MVSIGRAIADSSAVGRRRSHASLSYERQFRAWALWHAVAVRVALTLECMGALSGAPTLSMLPRVSCEKCEKRLVSMRGLAA